MPRIDNNAIVAAKRKKKITMRVNKTMRKVGFHKMPLPTTIPNARNVTGSMVTKGAIKMPKYPKLPKLKKY